MSLAARELRDAAMTDPLTGFYNRKALDAIVDLELGAALCEKDTFGVLYLDLDGFKTINDTLGHAAGDRVLVEASTRIRDAVREDDVVVRMGATNSQYSCRVRIHPRSSTALRKNCSTRFGNRFMWRVSVLARLSIGGAIAPQAGADRATLLRSVDEALYQAKNRGATGLSAAPSERLP